MTVDDEEDEKAKHTSKFELQRRSTEKSKREETDVTSTKEKQNMSSGALHRGIPLSRSFKRRNMGLATDNSLSLFRNYSRFLPAPSKEDPLDVSLSDYEAFRRSLCGGSLNYKALFVDAAGTLIVPSQPAAKVYQTIGKMYGVELSEGEILARYRLAYAKPWCNSRLRFEDDARPFWRHIVELSTGCKDPKYSEELYQYYTSAEAWKLVDPNAEKIFRELRNAGVKLAVVSNFDTRLRPLMKAMECHDWFDALAISAEVGAEKPNPAIFLAACDLLKVKPEEAVHVGDDRRNDVWGARDAGCDAWLWGEDVNSFRQVAEKIGIQFVE